MSKTLLLICALISGSFCFANEYSVPEEYWPEMDDYSMSYEGCDVTWHTRTGSFLVSGEGCEKIKPETMRNDAISRIRDIRNSPPQLTLATNIWESGCSDFKKGLTQGDFRTINIDEIIRKYPQVTRNVKVKLYFDGWNTAKNLDGFLSCKEVGEHRASSFLEGVSIFNTP